MSDQNKGKDLPAGGPANRDPLTKTPGAHPVGVGAGAASGGAAGAAIGAAVGGPIGAVVGAAIGAVSGGLGGKAVAESVNPTHEDAYWREQYPRRSYARKEVPYEHYQPAYRHGWESRALHGGKQWNEVEPQLKTDWEKKRGTSTLSWEEARHASRDAWDRLDERTPQDDSTGSTRH